MMDFEKEEANLRRRTIGAIRWGWFWIGYDALFTVVFTWMAFNGAPWWYWVFAAIFVALTVLAVWSQRKNYERKWYNFGSDRRRQTH